ncbi:MAG: IreB family regulatory phosphoprotein [Oscillospiraceae bacterium]|nr:IreB family regulatory phosphoprotein [Oscillospiraceae bacterium]
MNLQDTRQKTITFSVKDTRREEIREIVRGVYNSLIENGYNPTNQIVGYIISEDPTYITNYKNARTIISKLDRDELLRALVEDFIRLEKFEKG